MAPPIAGLKLTFADEFNSLNLYSTWKPHDQWGNRYLAGNSELQMYVDPKYKGLNLNPFSVNNGVLNIKAAKAGGLASRVGKSYTSGMLSSHGSGGFSQQYGYFEIRAQLPAGKGMWPAFWLLADHGKWPPELDVMESIGSNTNYAVQSIHSRDGNRGKTTWTSENLQQGFHTYGMNWTKSTISYYIDGKKTAEYATPSDMHTKMHMLVNLAVGGSWPGSPNGSTDWSKTNYKIDYVRAYSSDPNAKPVPGGSGSTPTPSDPKPPTDAKPPTDPSTTPSEPTTPIPSDPGSGDSAANGRVILSNTMDSSNLWDHYKVNVAPDSSRTYSAREMQVGGVFAPTSVTVRQDSGRDVSVTNNGEWSGIRNVKIDKSAFDDVAVHNFVDVQLDLGDGSRKIAATRVKRGEINTGNGSDTIEVTGKSNSNDSRYNLLTINAGDGNNKVHYDGEWQNRVRINTGSGADEITVAGQVPSTVRSGAGNDRINVETTNGVTLYGGTGRDVFSFLASAHATIKDFNRGQDSIELRGFRSSDVHVRTSGGSTLIDLGGGNRITVAGVATNRDGLNLHYA